MNGNVNKGPQRCKWAVWWNAIRPWFIWPFSSPDRLYMYRSLNSSLKKKIVTGFEISYVAQTGFDLLVFLLQTPVKNGRLSLSEFCCSECGSVYLRQIKHIGPSLNKNLHCRGFRPYTNQMLFSCIKLVDSVMTPISSKFNSTFSTTASKVSARSMESHGTKQWQYRETRSADCHFCVGN